MAGVSTADMFSLDGVARLLANRAAVLPAWCVRAMQAPSAALCSGPGCAASLCVPHSRLVPPAAASRRLHYVVFDLWTARWEVSDALEHGVPQVALSSVLSMFGRGPRGASCARNRPLAPSPDRCPPLPPPPCLPLPHARRAQLAMAVPLFMTCMAGPAGLLLYLLAVRPLFGHSDAERRAAKMD